MSSLHTPKKILDFKHKLNTNEFNRLSKRYCLVCENIMQFSYNKIIGHSQCDFCGSRYGIKVEDIKRYIDEHKNEDLTKIKECYEKLLKQNRYKLMVGEK